MRFDSKIIEIIFLISGIMVQTISSDAQTLEIKHDVLARIAAIPAREDFAILAAKIRTNADTANSYRHLDTLLATGYGDMFWMYGCAGLYYASADQLRPD